MRHSLDKILASHTSFLQPSFKVSIVIFFDLANSSMLSASLMSSIFTDSLEWSVVLSGVNTKVYSSSFTRKLFTVSCILSSDDSSVFSLSQALKKLLTVVWIVFLAPNAIGWVSTDGVGDNLRHHYLNYYQYYPHHHCRYRWELWLYLQYISLPGAVRSS